MRRSPRQHGKTAALAALEQELRDQGLTVKRVTGGKRERLFGDPPLWPKWWQR